jgi:hypothetical protein
MNENEFDFYFAGISWGECFDILSPYQKRLPEDISDIYLHDNLIGRYNHLTKSIWINSCGWQTNTTKSRINALLDLLPNKKYGIFQKNFDWFIWDRIEDKTYPFFDCLIFSIHCFTNGAVNLKAL